MRNPFRRSEQIGPAKPLVEPMPSRWYEIGTWDGHRFERLMVVSTNRQKAYKLAESWARTWFALRNVWQSGYSKYNTLEDNQAIINHPRFREVYTLLRSLTPTHMYRRWDQSVDRFAGAFNSLQHVEVHEYGCSAKAGIVESTDIPAAFDFTGGRSPPSPRRTTLNTSADAHGQ